MRFLIIDDDAEDVEYFVEVVGRFIPECACDIATSCEEGLDILRGTIDLPTHVFLDGMLHGMSSQECLQKIKADERLCKIRIIVYSGYASPAVQLDFLRLGADKFVLKPSSTAELEKSLQEVLLL
jgi:CheY-like chemotaxis protein